MGDEEDQDVEDAAADYKILRAMAEEARKKEKKSTTNDI